MTYRSHIFPVMLFLWSFQDLTANRNLAELDRGLARCSSGVGRMISSEIVVNTPSRRPSLKGHFTLRVFA